MRLPLFPLLCCLSLSVGTVVGDDLTIGVVQMTVVADKPLNVQTAVSAIEKAAAQGAQLVILPECWNTPYSTDLFAEYAEAIPSGPSSLALSFTAKEYKIFIVGGTIPEVDSATGAVYNTCPVFGPTGEFLGKYRKNHLFKIFTETVQFDESLSLTAGEELLSFDALGHTIGIGICFDIRYPELALDYVTQHNATMLIYPGAFNMVTGPVHWSLTGRARAVDNQVFLVLCSPSRAPEGSKGYIAYGHSMVISPWGDILSEADSGDQILITTLKAADIADTRKKLPITAGRKKRTTDGKCLAGAAGEHESGTA